MPSASNEDTVFDHKTFLKNLGEFAGVYQMYDIRNELLYVGKAKNLKKRIASYFRASGLSTKTAALVSRIADIQVTVTNTETEALILEHNLIKTHRPPYNILLRDDKSYPYIFISAHKYPRLAVHRGVKKAKGQYFGPYPNASAVRESLAFLQKVFKVRQCEDNFFRNRSRPCLQYQIKRCTAPCVDMISNEEYAEDVQHTAMFLEGKSQQLIATLAKQMDDAAKKLAYEEASVFRDQIQSLQQIQATQYIEGESGDLDIVACDYQAGLACVQLLYVRMGRILGSRNFYPRHQLAENRADIINGFIGQHYLSNIPASEIPREIAVSDASPENTMLAEALSERANKRVSIVHKVRANRAKWLQLGRTTAEQNLKAFLASRNTLRQRFELLQDALGLDELPERLECFDISHTQGEATVASCVVFDSNGPLKSDYRRFNIENITAGDDYAAMAQALERRYLRLKKGEGKLPNILFVDGGKGQVTQTVAVLTELQIDDVLIIGVSKGRDRKAGQEVLYNPKANSEFVLPADSPALHLIQHIRDESHRFAISGHRQRRQRARKTSSLEQIPGIGAKRRKELLRHFGGLQGVVAASVDDLAKVPTISPKIAQDIYDALRDH